MNCKCPNKMHGPNGCLIQHDQLLGDCCQCCIIDCLDSIFSNPTLIIKPCTHKRYKIEIENETKIKHYYCKVCKKYIDKYVKTHVLPPSDESIVIMETNKFSPSTCGCVTRFAFYHDDIGKDSAPIQNHLHHVICDNHLELHGQELHDTIFKENQLATLTLNKYLDTIPELNQIIDTGKLNERGEPITQIKYPPIIEFSGTGKNRILSVRFKDYVIDQKTADKISTSITSDNTLLK